MTIDLSDWSKTSLELMAEFLTGAIGSGQTHNSLGVPLQAILDEANARIPSAPDYEIEHRRNGYWISRR